MTTEERAERARASRKKWREANLEKQRAAEARWKKDNRERVYGAHAEWRARNPSCSAFAGRRDLKDTRSVAWANQFLINEIYLLARLRTEQTGLLWVVDHVIPLKGKNVSGLHVENNLQVILSEDNSRKKNKFDTHDELSTQGEPA